MCDQETSHTGVPVMKWRYDNLLDIGCVWPIKVGGHSVYAAREKSGWLDAAVKPHT
jgi:hypothetical protein